ncbi:Hpt domain-containing protein [Aestuariivirga sp.]|uniref:Hpt domain-containing protein n=1 Tax=Aestuariivirga sp. TaxID=2650926 RepID=UPI003BADA06C
MTAPVQTAAPAQAGFRPSFVAMPGDGRLPPGKLTAILNFATEIHGYLSACTVGEGSPPQLAAASSRAAALLELTHSLRAEEEAALARVPVWDQHRLKGLLSDVGTSGVKDLLRLFQADMPHLISEISCALTNGDAGAAEIGLAAIEGAAANLGLAAVAAVAGHFRQRPLDPSIPQRLAQEIARATCIPPTKTTSRIT